MGEHEDQFVFEMGYNKGFKDGIKGSIPKADYEARLKADLKAILVELQLQMEEYEPKWVENEEQAVASCRTWEDLDGIIQEKINKLKGE